MCTVEEKFSRENADLVSLNQPKHYFHHIHISLKHRFVYFDTPKVASSSIKATLQRLELNDPEFMLPIEYVHSRYYSFLLSPAQAGSFLKIRQDRSFFKFCFVRNPFSRLLSGYLDKIVRNKPQKAIILESLGRSGDELSDEVSFDDFITALEIQQDNYLDAHWRPQISHLNVEKLQYDFIGHFESLSDDLEKVGELLGVNITPYLSLHDPHKTSASRKIDHYYSDRSIERVRDIYRDDFTAFRYSRRIEDAL